MSAPPRDRYLQTEIKWVSKPMRSVHWLVWQAMRTAIKEATASMTSVPKPLKFLRSHYTGLKATFNDMTEGANSQSLADILSVLAMTSGAEGSRESLQFCLKGGSETIGCWGHEYVR